MQDVRRGSCFKGLLSGLLLAFAGVAQATLIANSAAGTAEPHAASLSVVNGSSGVVSTINTISPSALAAASGYGEAAYGALHASAVAVAANGDAQARGQGSSLWIDNVTLSSSFIGTATGRGTFDLSGALSSRVGPTSTGGVANSGVAVNVSLNGVTVFNVNAQLVSRNGVIEINTVDVSGVNVSFTPGVLSGAYSFDMPFTLGTSFQLFASMNSIGQAISSSGVDDTEAVSNFASTGTWGGISDVHLANGTLVSGFGVRSDSGFDWSHAYGAAVPPVTAVPEPGTYALMLAGLAVLGRVARRQARGSVLRP
jgi:hypothetical protein